MGQESRTDVIYRSGASEGLPGWDVMQVVYRQQDGGHMRIANSFVVARDASGKIIRKTDILLDRWEVAAPGHYSPAHDVVTAFCQRTWRHGNLPGKEGHGHRRLHTVGGRELQGPLAGHEALRIDGGDEALVELLEKLSEPYLKLWVEHSETVRLSGETVRAWIFSACVSISGEP